MADKYCVSCAHYRPRDQFADSAMCVRIREPIRIRDMVSGKETAYQIAPQACYLERLNGSCGQDGIFFTPKEPG